MVKLAVSVPILLVVCDTIDIGDQGVDKWHPIYERHEVHLQLEAVVGITVDHRRALEARLARCVAAREIRKQMVVGCMLSCQPISYYLAVLLSSSAGGGVQRQWH